MADLKPESKASADKAKKAARGLPAKTLALGLHSVALELAELRDAILFGAPLVDLNEVSRKLLEQARKNLADPQADAADQDVSTSLLEMTSVVSREIRAIRELGAWGSVVGFASVPFIVEPVVTAFTPAGRALVDGVNTVVDYSTPGQAAIDVVGAGSFGEIQYNNAGDLGGVTGFVFDGTDLLIPSLMKLFFGTANSYIQSGAVNELSILATTLIQRATTLDVRNYANTRALLQAIDTGAGSADYLRFANGTGTVPITAVGTSATIHINVVPKGTGRLQENGVNVLLVGSDQSVLLNQVFGG